MEYRVHDDKLRTWTAGPEPDGNPRARVEILKGAILENHRGTASDIDGEYSRKVCSVKNEFPKLDDLTAIANQQDTIGSIINAGAIKCERKIVSYTDFGVGPGIQAADYP